MKKMITLVLVAVLTVVGFGLIPDQAQAAANDTQKPFVIGAYVDVPDGFTPSVSISTLEERDMAIDETAKALAAGENIVIAGGPAGPVSASMYESIIEEAQKITPNHGGSIVRIGGRDAEETQRFMMDFLSSVHYF